MKGPKHAFFYTNMKGLFNMWDSSGIRPDTSTFGNHSSTMIYMCPVPLTDIDCPYGCQIYEEHQTIVVVIDFEMVIDDSHTCFYAYDGRLAIKTKRIGMAYVEALIDTTTGAMIYLRNFVRVNGQRLPAVSDMEDSVDDRRIKTETCFVCGNHIWIGCTSCMHCNSPVLYAQNLPDFNPDDFSVPPACVETWSKEDRKVISEVIIQGRKAVSKHFETTFNINTDFPEGEMKSQDREATRSFGAQGKRSDQELCRAERLPYKTDDELASSINTIKLRIDHDARLRMKIARPVLTVSSNALPARILKSQLHTYAYTMAIQHGEIDRENLGQRTRRDMNLVE
jgi:hypothetical protein